MGRARANALLLHAEVTNVISVMRLVPKWSVVPRQYSVRGEIGVWALTVISTVHTHTPFPLLLPSHIPLVASQEEEDGDEPLLEEFKLLRRKVFTWQGEGGGLQSPQLH